MWDSWTLSVAGYCVQASLISYSPAPMTEGDVFSWAATAALCDPSSAPAIGMLKLHAVVRTPPVPGLGCSYPKHTFSGGTVIATSSSPTGAGAATYFEWGDGRTPPPDATGVKNGRTPEALGVCAGRWHVVLTTSVLPATSGAWIDLGTRSVPLDVALSPAFGQPRPVQVTLDDTVSSPTRCVHHTFQLYDTTPAITVGDPFEYSYLHQTCEPAGAPLLYGLKENDTFAPPAGCPERPWLLQGPDGSTSGSGSPQISLYGTIYGAGEARVVVNCPGTWVITMRSWVDVTPGTPRWVHVGDSTIDVEVLPHV